MLELLRNLDVQLLLAINRLHNPVMDAVMVTVSNRYTWFPAYALIIAGLIYLFRRRAVLLLPLLILAVTLADSITSRIFKPFFERPRPCHDLKLSGLLHLADGCGGQFGFLSSHAANSMALAVFMAVALPPGRFQAAKWALFFWALLLSYSRMYLGAHYPTDVVGGAALGAFLGWATAVAYRRWAPRMGPEGRRLMR
ncbi:hypothetical protein GCM10027511_20020 [Hymenobacter humi]